MSLRIADLMKGQVTGMIAELDPELQEPVGCELVMGAVYRYISDSPKGCKGRLYRLHREVVDVPSYQRKVLVEALTGPDKGLWFTCVLTNFAMRYELAEISS